MKNKIYYTLFMSAVQLALVCICFYHFFISFGAPNYIGILWLTAAVVWMREALHTLDEYKSRE